MITASIYVGLQAHSDFRYSFHNFPCALRFRIIRISSGAQIENVRARLCQVDTSSLPATKEVSPRSVLKTFVVLLSAEWDSRKPRGKSSPVRLAFSL
jgi:hypothetical protein